MEVFLPGRLQGGRFFEALTDWRCRQRALVKKTDFHEDVPTRCDCRIVREVEAQRAVVMAFNTLPSRREELVVARERLQTGEIGRIDALKSTWVSAVSGMSMYLP